MWLHAQLACAYMYDRIPQEAVALNTKLSIINRAANRGQPTWNISWAGGQPDQAIYEGRRERHRRGDQSAEAAASISSSVVSKAVTIRTQIRPGSVLSHRTAPTAWPSRSAAAFPSESSGKDRNS